MEASQIWRYLNSNKKSPADLNLILKKTSLSSHLSLEIPKCHWIAPNSNRQRIRRLRVVLKINLSLNQ
jgi:hypothetical protein